MQEINRSKSDYDVSVILSTKNRASLLDQMLTSLEEAVAGIRYEVIVVEGGSGDNTMEVLRKHGIINVYSELQYLGLGRHGWPELYNFGFSRASGTWAMYASDDIVFSKDCIAKAVEMLQHQKEEVAGGIFFYRNIDSRPDWDKFGIDFTHGSKLLMNYGLVRLDCFRQVGGLDQSYRFYCADSDFCYKVYQSGHQFIPLPGCFIVHNNILDKQKITNSQAAQGDIELCKRRWKHFVPEEVPYPRRLLWQEDFTEMLSLPEKLQKINSGIEYIWQGLAFFQKESFEQAKLKFLQALNNHCDHWHLLWYIAKAAYNSADNSLAYKTAKAVANLEPDFHPAKDLIQKLNSNGNNLTENNSRKDMSGLIFSRDRAMQLQATLESFFLHCKDSGDIRLVVLYKASTPMHQHQYDNLKKRYSKIRFIKEMAFKQQMLEAIETCEHIFFMVDDNIFTHDFFIKDVVSALRVEPEAIGFSLRLGRNTDYCYTKNAKQALPRFEHIEKSILKYDWRTSEFDFGYPLELSSSVYRTSDISGLIRQLEFDNPNLLEGAMAANVGLFAQKKGYLLCYDKSVTFCNPANKVQSVCDNRSGINPELAPESLSEMFENNFKIDVIKYCCFVSNSCHQEVELYFTKENPPLTDPQKENALKGKKAETTEPFITVEMAAYNAEKYISKAIDSVLAQTYGNFELLIVDDGSTDGTRKIIESKYDSRIRYIYQPHKNCAAARNRIISEAKGEFLLCVDSDDLVELTYIEKMVACAVNYPDVDYFYPSRLTIVNEQSDPTGFEWEYEDYSNNTTLPSLLFSRGYGLIPNPGSLKRRSLFDKVGLYEDLDTVEDFVFLCRNALKINFKRVDDHKMYFYRVLESSSSRRYDARNRIMAKMLNDMVSIYPMEVLCPQLAEISDPNVRERQYYTYLATTFEKLSCGEMVRYKEYFLQYAEYYRNRSLNCITEPADNVTFVPPADKADCAPDQTKNQPNQYLVTAIVSTYNAEQFLRGCLDGLEQQTIADKLEIIVVNSGSQQNEESIVREYKQKYDNIVYIKTEYREGIYTAWNRAVKAARGKYITNANTDDRHRRDALEIMADTLESAPDVGLVYGDQICTDTPNGTFANHHAIQMVRKPEYSRQGLLLGCCTGSQPMWRKSVHDEIGYFDDSLTCAADWDFWLRISEKYQLKHIPEFLGIYYYNKEGIEHGRKIHSLYERYIVGKRYGTPYISVIPIYKTKGNPLVSVIMPAYNAADYIADAIESVLIQNYQNFELIVIDDGSTDNTKDIVSGFDDERIRYFYQKNKGLPGACNPGIKNSKGPFIIKLDIDDMMTPDFIAKHLAKFETHPDADLVYCDDLLINEEYKILRIVKRTQYTDRNLLIRDMFQNGFPVIPFRTCIRRSVFDKIGFFNENHIISEDYDMMRRFVKAGLKAYHLNEALYLRRMTKESVSRSYTEEKGRCLIKIIKSFTETFSYDELFPGVEWGKNGD